MIVRYKKLIDCFAIIPHIDVKWVIQPQQFKLYYIRFAWLFWGIDIIIFYKKNYD